MRFQDTTRKTKIPQWLNESVFSLKKPRDGTLVFSFPFFSLNSLNVMRYGSNIRSSCRTILMLLAIEETEWCIFSLSERPRAFAKPRKARDERIQGILYLPEILESFFRSKTSTTFLPSEMKGFDVNETFPCWKSANINTFKLTHPCTSVARRLLGLDVVER